MISMPAVGIKRKLEGPFDYISDQEKFDQHNFKSSIILRVFRELGWAWLDRYICPSSH